MMNMTPELEVALRAWLADSDHIADENLDEPLFENGLGPLDAALVRAGRAVLHAAESPVMDNEDREFFDLRFREIAARLESKGLTPNTSKYWSAEIRGTVYHFGLKSYCKSRGSRLGEIRKQIEAEAQDYADNAWDRAMTHGRDAERRLADERDDE